jgi:holo-[acyl-carrier protein] synthase
MIGIDIVEIERIKSSHEKFGKLFLDKIFTAKEQAYCDTYKYPFERYAGRFAAKEAVAKLIEKGPKDFWLDIEILSNDNGAPAVHLSQRLKAIFPHAISLSISHERNYAVAAAIVVPNV